MPADSIAAVRATVARYAGWFASLLDTTTRPLTEPLGWRPPRATRPTVATTSPPSIAPEPTLPDPMVRTPAATATTADRTRTPRKATQVPTQQPHDGTGDRLYVARPRTNARRPGKVVYRYAEFRQGMEVPPSGFLARKAGRRYVAVSTSE